MFDDSILFKGRLSPLVLLRLFTPTVSLLQLLVWTLNGNYMYNELVRVQSYFIYSLKNPFEVIAI